MLSGSYTAHCATNAQQAPNAFSSLLEYVIAQNTPLHDGYPSRPSCVPNYFSWYAGRSIQAATPPGTHSACQGWGTCFPIEGIEQMPFSEFEISDYRVYVRTSGVWNQVQSPGVGGLVLAGGAFRADFLGNAATAVTITDIPAQHGGRVTLPICLSPPNPDTAITVGDTTHFWPDPRGTFVNAGTDYFYNTALIRCTDVRDVNKFCINLGGDWWEDANVAYGDGSHNPGIGMGNFVKLDLNYRRVAFYSCTEAQFRSTYTGLPAL